MEQKIFAASTITQYWLDNTIIKIFFFWQCNHYYWMKESCFLRIASKALVRIQQNLYTTFECKGGSRHKNWCMARVLSFLIRYFSNYYTLHRSDLAARAASLDPRLDHQIQCKTKMYWFLITLKSDCTL